MDDPINLQSIGRHYQIRILGVIDESWSDRLGGMGIVQSEDEEQEGMPVTDLIGWLPDQAALFGVLNTLYNNRLVVLAIVCRPPV